MHDGGICARGSLHRAGPCAVLFGIRWGLLAFLCAGALSTHAEDLGSVEVSWDGHRPVIEWSNTVGRAYVIQRRDQVAAALWHDGVTLTTDAPRAGWADDGALEAARFYRIRLSGDAGPFQQLQQALQRACSNQGITGASAAVVFANGQVWVGTTGYSHARVRIGPQTPFEVGSVTKTFVAATVLRLVDEGRVGLDDTVGEWLPELRHPNIAPEITVRQLLSHRAGTYNFGDDPDFRQALFTDWSRAWQPEEVLDYVKAPYFSPDTGGQYSNTGYVLLGMIIRKATSTSMAAALRQRVLEPVGLRSTVLGGEETWIGEMAHPHLDFNGDGVHEDLGDRSQIGILSSFWTSGAVVTTAADVARFGKVLFEGGLLGVARLDEMRAFGPVDVGGVSVEYGLGLMRFDVLGREHWAHSGGLFGEYGWLSYCPATGVSLGVAYNHPNTKATGANLPGELLVALSAIAEGLAPSSSAGAGAASRSPTLPRIPFLQ